MGSGEEGRLRRCGVVHCEQSIGSSPGPAASYEILAKGHSGLVK